MERKARQNEGSLHCGGRGGNGEKTLEHTKKKNSEQQTSGAAGEKTRSKKMGSMGKNRSGDGQSAREQKTLMGGK